MLFRRAWMLGLCACSVFPERAVLPDDGSPSGGAGGGAGIAGGDGGVTQTGGAGSPSGGSSGMATVAGSAGGPPEAAGGAGGGAGMEPFPSEGGAGPTIGGAGGVGGVDIPPCEEPIVTTVKADADTWLSERAPNDNFDTSASLQIGTIAGDRAHALLLFEIPRLAANLESARLVFELRTSPGETRTLAVYRVTRSWRDGQVNWNRARNGNNNAWTTPGGDVADERSGAAEVPAGAPVGTLVAFDVSADVLDMSMAPEKNLGWLVRHDTDGAARIELAASEFGSGTPVLELTSCP